MPWWAEYAVTNLYQNTSMDSGLTGIGSFGNDYIAGGANNDLIFGQLGNDTIQGDGSIDYISHRYVDDVLATIDPNLLGGRVTAYRTPGAPCTTAGGMCDPIGPLTVYPSYEAATDGDDYIEGGAGNDIAFGGLGQDDIVGGSSSMFSLTTRDQRPDGSDLLFGGAGTRIARDLDSMVGAADQHARDADTLVGDNGNIVRIVGTNHVDVGPVLKYVTFNYDNYSPTAKIVVRGVTQLDYTWGGPDFHPELFGLTAHAGFSEILTVLPGRNIWTVDIGGNDELHGESGDDTAYGGVGHDVIYGDAQDDDLIGGWGNDWISGGTGQDGILGDDGRIFTSRNTACPGAASSAVCTQFTEPLYGIYGLRQTDPDTRTSQGDVLSEFIYTPGQVQTATINVATLLKKQFDLTPYDQSPDSLGLGDQIHYDANNSDDILFGGLDDDFIHGAVGDDAIGGNEALLVSYMQTYNPICDQQVNCANGLVRTDWTRPFNPGDILHFGADTNPWNSNHHNAARLGEFFLYDEFDPRRAIMFDPLTFQVWKTGPAPTSRQYFLNFDATDGTANGRLVFGCIQTASNGSCLASAFRATDGDDVLFGDLGSDWLVGGTGRDNIFAGYGNDISNADDDLSTNGWLNDMTDTHPTYLDRTFGGGGIDIHYGNTEGDRLIDWVGEYDSYIVPFSAFGINTVSRQVEPSLPEFLYALSFGLGADPTRAAETSASVVSAARRGEPYGELGLVIQQDHGLWQVETGGPTDPQSGGIPGSKRDVLRSADFNSGTMQGFAVDSGSFAVTNGTLGISATSTTGDAAAVFYADVYLPIYYEVAAAITIAKPTAGYKANSYVIFDYWSPTDFKFAGIDLSTNKLAVGHRTSTGWIQDAFAPFIARADAAYDILIQVNGTSVIVNAGSKSFSYLYGPRMVSGEPQGLNKGLLGFGSDQSRGTIDNVAIQVLPPQITLDTTEDFNDGAANLFTGTTTGTWAPTSADQRYSGTSTGTAAATKGIDLGTTPLQPESYIEYSTQARTAQMAGLVFDQYSANDYKFVAIDVAGQRIVVGHQDRIRGFVVEQTVAKTLLATTDYTLSLTLKGTSVAVTLNGTYVTSWGYNAPVADGSLGLFTKGGTSSFDNVHIRTNDPVFAASGNVLSGALNTSQPVATEAMLASALTAAKSYWAARLGIPLSSLNYVRIAIADLPGTEIALTVGGTVYVDRDGGGGGWTTTTLNSVVQQELGHILGQN